MVMIHPAMKRSFSVFNGEKLNNYVDCNKEMIHGCQKGNIQIVDEMIQKGANRLKDGFKEACKNGHTDIATLIMGKCDLDLSFKLRISCQNGLQKLANTIIGTTNNYLNRKLSLNHGLLGACLGGYQNLADLMIRYGATDLDLGLFGACKGGHTKLVNLMISYGAKNWNKGLNGACEGGHLKLVNLMIQKGAKYEFHTSKNPGDLRLFIPSCAKYWGDNLNAACELGNLDIVKIIIETGDLKDDMFKVSMIGAIQRACLSGNIEVVDFLIHYHIQNYCMNLLEFSLTFFSQCLNWDELLRSACLGGNEHVVDIIIKKAKEFSKHRFNWNDGLCYACKGGHLDLVEKMIEMGASDFDDECFDYACIPGRQNILELLIFHCARPWNLCLMKACYHGNVNVINMMIDKGANCWKGALLSACKGGQKEIVQWILLTKPVTNLNEALHFASQSDFDEEYLINLLIAHGAKDRDGKSLMLLLDQKYFHSAKILIEHNACRKRDIQIIKSKYLVKLLNLGICDNYLKCNKFFNNISKFHEQLKKHIQSQLEQHLPNDVIKFCICPYLLFKEGDKCI